MNDGQYGTGVTEEFCPAEACMLTATFVTQDATGADVNDGSIMITAANGMGPYDYSIDGVTYQSDASFSSLSAGDYSVSTRDTNGCIVSTEVTLSLLSFVGAGATMGHCCTRNDCKGCTLGQVQKSVCDKSVYKTWCSGGIGVSKWKL